MKKTFAIALLFSSWCSFAQPDSGFVVHKGILAGVGTVGVGVMPTHNLSNVYITGNIEYYTQHNISIRGDGYFFLNSLTNNSNLIRNSSVYFGAFYHFTTHSGFDPLVGFQPGAAFARTTDSVNGRPDAGAIAPLLSIIAGFNFFGEKWFHIQANIRYTMGQESTEQAQFNLTEWSFNFGLGFNIDMIKKHRTFRNIDEGSSF